MDTSSYHTDMPCGYGDKGASGVCQAGLRGGEPVTCGEELHLEGRRQGFRGRAA